MDLEIPVSQKILKSVSALDRFNGSWPARSRISAPRLESLSQAARIRSIGASCRLSGIRVSDADVEVLLRGASAPVGDAREVVGYAAAHDRGLPPSSQVLSVADLGRLHALLEGADPEPAEPSPWRTTTHHREAFDADGRARGRVFSTLPPHLVASTTEDLLTWLELELRGGGVHPIPVIATFVLAFLAVSPFAGRNGRMARLLTRHLLVRAGYRYVTVGSPESEIEAQRDRYHDAFDAAQTRLWSGGGDLEPWVTFFLEVLERDRERVETRFELERDALDYPPLQRAILDTVREHGSVDAALLLRATQANRNTLKDNLRRLVDRGVLERTGRSRGTRYRLASLPRWGA